MHKTKVNQNTKVGSEFFFSSHFMPSWNTCFCKQNIADEALCLKLLFIFHISTSPIHKHNTTPQIKHIRTETNKWINKTLFLSFFSSIMFSSFHLTFASQSTARTLTLTTKPCHQNQATPQHWFDHNKSLFLRSQKS